jgi:amino acid transporter
MAVNEQGPGPVSTGPDERHSLRKNAVGLPGLIAQSLGVTAPEISGVLIASSVAAYAGLITPLAFVVAGIGAIGLGLVYSRFARYVPHAGGTYAIVRAGLGPDLGFMAGWILLAVGIIFVAGLVIASAFLLQLFGSPAVKNISFLGKQWTGTAIFLGALVLLISFLGIQISAKVLLTLTAVGVALLAVFDVVILAKGGAHGLAWSAFNPANISKVGVSTFFIGVGLAMTGFSGFETAVFLSEEANAPRKQVPKAVVGAVLAAVVFFAVTTFAIVTGYGAAKAGPTWAGDGPFTVISLSAKFLKVGYGQLLLLILAISGAVSALGTANFTTRVAYSWGREGYLPAAFGRTHPKFRTPSVANGALAVTTLGIILAGAAWKGQTLDLNTFFLAGFVVFSWLLLCGAAGILPVYALVGLSGFAHSLRNHGTVVDIVIAPLLAVAVVATAEFTQFYHQTGANKIAPLVMVAWVVLGVIVRLATRSRVRAAEAQFDAAPAEAGIQSADMAG